MVLYAYRCRRAQNDRAVTGSAHLLAVDLRRRAPFKYETVSDVECQTYFRFSKEQLERLAPHLVPPVVRLQNGRYVDRMEALCLFLRRMAYPSRWTDIQLQFPRHQRDLSAMFYIVLNHVYDAHNHRLLLDPSTFTRDDLEVLSEAVQGTGALIPTCIGFIDGTVRPIARPVENQRQSFNGHKRTHALKYQGIMAPNGLFLEMYGPHAGVDHDARLFHESNLHDRLQRLPRPSSGDLPFLLYGDPAYPTVSGLVAPYRGDRLEPWQQVMNTSMSSVREAVEHGFKGVITDWAYVDFKKGQKLLQQPVGKFYLVATILANMKACIIPNQISTKFGLKPPTLEDYLNGHVV
jgi:hypothetical protein